MAEHDPNPEQGQTPQPAYTPASFEKRAAAWMGIAYMLMLMFVITYTIFTARDLPGTFPLFLVPAAAAGLVVAVHRQRKGTARLPLTILTTAAFAAAIVLGLWLGIPALLAALTAPMG